VVVININSEQLLCQSEPYQIHILINPSYTDQSLVSSQAMMVTIIISVLLFVSKLDIVVSLDQAIILKFGDNSVRIEKDGQDQGEEGTHGGRQSGKKELGRYKGRRCASSQCIEGDYDKMALPDTEKATEVHTSFELRDVIDIDDDKFTITFSMYFGVKWKEPRLINHDNSSQPNWMAIDLDFVENLWLPNIFIYDLKEFKAIHVLHKLAALYVVKEGELFYQQSTHVTFLCAMRFESYPLDSHNCKFRLGSSSYNDQKMKFSTTLLDYDFASQNTILDYHVTVEELGQVDRQLFYGELGNFSLAGFQFSFKRHMAKYVWNYHFPSGLFVLVSWVSFLISPSVVPGRMGLLVTLFLVLTNMFNTINTVSPTVEGMTSISIWLLSCILFVAGAVAEYAVILYLKRALDCSPPLTGTELGSRTITMNKDKFDQWLVSLGEKVPKTEADIARVDKMALIIFSSSFMVFNLLYWSNMLKK